MRLLGDLVHSALAVVGITPEKVESFIGRPCGCRERIEKLNRLDAWARRIVSGNVEDAEKHLEAVIDDERFKTPPK